MRVSIVGFSTAILVSILAGTVLGETNGKIVCSGKITDANSEPIADANVTLYKFGFGESMRDLNKVATEEIMTGSDGTFKFEAAKEDEPRDSVSLVLAEKKGYSFGFVNWMRVRDLETDIELTEPMVFAGAVVDESNEPISDVNISILLMLIPDEKEPRYVTGMTSSKLLKTLTDSNGQFRFERIPKGASVEFVLSKKGREALCTFKGQYSPDKGFTYSAGTDDIKFVLPVEARIEGAVVDGQTDNPVGGVKLMIRPTEGQLLYGVKPVESDSNGVFCIENLPAGELSIQQSRLMDKSLEWIFEPVTVTTIAGQTTSDVRIEVNRGNLLEIFITDAKTGESVERVSVHLRPVESQRYEGRVTDANGIALFRLNPGQYEIGGFYKEGYQQGNRRNEIVTVEKDKKNRLEMEITPVAKLVGIVKDKKGKPVSDVEVRLVPHGSREQKTDEQGRFEMRWDRVWSNPNEEVPFYIIARHPERNLAAVVEVERDVENIEIMLDDGVIVFGRAIDSNDNPISDAKVRVMFRAGHYGSSIANYQRGGAMTNSQGVFEMPAVPCEHSYDVYVFKDGYGKARQNIYTDDVENGRFDAGVFVLPEANLTLSGVVVDQNDKPVEGARLYISGQNQPEINNLKTDEQGKFEVKVCPGRIHLNANYSKMNEHMWGNMTVVGGAEDVKLVISKQGSHGGYVAREPSSLKDKKLPDVNEFGVKLSAEDVNDKMVLVCFWDVQQRPARHCMKQLIGQSERLKEKGVLVIAVQVSQVDGEMLNGWLDKNESTFVVGTIEGDIEKVRFKWGAKTIPWLMLADSNGIVVTEGFSIYELEDKLKATNQQ